MTTIYNGLICLNDHVSYIIYQARHVFLIFIFVNVVKTTNLNTCKWGKCFALLQLPQVLKT